MQPQTPSLDAETLLKQVAEPKCSKCSRMPVCCIFRSFNLYLTKEFPENSAPFSALDLAKLCKAYFPMPVALEAGVTP